ncbi:MAG: putative geopeptide radical SAM maturase [Deltaproteobacteria bacterium]|nr:putative geopeptide radical SAM maturase [Deltaproteobacteria bacterium]
MILSKYIKKFPCDNDSEYIILYSTRKASAIRIEREMFDDIKEGNISDEDVELLSDLEFLVTSEKTEREELENYIEYRDNLGTEVRVTVVLNLDCNFNCTYCIEGKIKGKHYFSKDNEDLLFKFIEDLFTNDKDSLRIDFYGGEPLLSKDLIRSISEKAIKFVKKRDAKYSFNMVSNGSLLTRKTAEEFSKLCFEGVQITLDGNRENHDKNRPFVNGSPSFDIILKNIKESYQFCKIIINCNYQESNYKEFLKLPEFLKKESLGPDKIDIIFTPVIDQTLDQTAQGYTRGFSNTLPWMVEAEMSLRAELVQTGYDIKDIVPTVCMIERKDMFYIHYNGDIYKCPNFLNHPKFVIGNLKDGIKDYTESHKLGIWKKEKCFHCEYLPLCFGGCRFFSLIRHGNIDEIDCWKEYYDINLETLVKQDLRSKGVL